jgi:Xaa-Pro aminopeptidase
MKSEDLLLVADSEHDADMLYAVRVFVPDPFIYLRINGRSHIVLNDLEIDRVRRRASHCRVLSLSTVLASLRKKGVEKVDLPHVIREVLDRYSVRKVVIPARFPVGLARQLRRLRLKLKIRDSGLFPKRELKTADEVRKISASLMMAEVGMAEAVQVLKASKIGRGKQLFHRGLKLTSERLRTVINTAVLQAGGQASHTIVAGGTQACDPHEEGHGPLHAHQPIIIDIFPRSQKTGYFGDITRTFVKGKATESIRRIHQVVARSQELAISKLESGVPARRIHETVQHFFECEGFKSTRKGGRMMGFFHGTGHGVGLEIHEAPRISEQSEDILRTGHLVTIEPGLYYPELGGVRLEDMVLIRGRTARNLTHFEKVLEL